METGDRMDLDIKRWFILLCGILANLCQGATYASSIFAEPMLRHLNLMIQKPDGTMIPDISKWTGAFSLNLAILPVGMILAGKISDRKNPRIMVLVGGLLFSLGMFLAGYANSLTTLYLTFGIMMGLGSGAAYGTIMAMSVKWFPDHKGLASGLVVGALGFGPFVIVPIANALMSVDPDPSRAILFTFKALGLIFIIIMGLASIMITNPKEGYLPKGYTPSTANRTNITIGEDVEWTDMLKKPRFWLLYFLYAVGAFSGLLITSQTKQIAMGLESVFSSTEEAAAFASALIMALALANALGRVLWGYISDRLGRMQTLAMMFFITALTMLLMPNLSIARSTMLLAIVLIGACYGGYLGIFPSICADSFGSKNMSMNYAILFTSLSAAAIAGPTVGALISKSQGSYNMAFMVSALLAALGTIITISIMLTDKRTISIENA